MKNWIYIFLFLPGFIKAQQLNWNATFFTEQGEKIYVVLNAIRQNEVAETNVKVTGLSNPNYKLKVVFANGALGEIDGNIYAPIEPGEMVYNIKKDKNGLYKVRMFSFAPMDELPPPPAVQNVVVFTPVERTTTTITQTTTGGTDNASIGVNMGGMGVNVNVNINDPLNTTQTTQTTTTTTTTTINQSGTIRFNDPPLGQTPPPPPPVAPPPPPAPVGCQGALPMVGSEFQAALASIKKQNFEDVRLKSAKQITSINCLSTNQIKQIMMAFNFEDNRLDFAKYAYEFCTDRNKYFMLNDAFKFSSSVEAITDYVSHY